MVPDIATPCVGHCMSHMCCFPDRYLDALVGLRESPFLPRCKQLTRLRLEAELYALTQVTHRIQAPHSCSRMTHVSIAWARRQVALSGAS